MRKYLFIGMLMTIVYSSFAQTNTFPTSGNVGIGTTSPSSVLVPGTNLTINANGGYSSLILQNNGTDRGFFTATASQAILGTVTENTNLQLNTNGLGRMLIDPNGFVGIGTSNPTSALDVAGLIQISGINSVAPPPGLAYGLFGYAGVGLGIFSGATGPHQGIGFWTNRDNVRTEVVRINNSGDVGIGTIDPKGYKLAVNGNIRAREIKVENANWPDYVFSKDYQLPTLQQTEKHIKEKGHLPGIPSAAEIKANGIDLGEMNAKLLQKIEELTLHLIEKEKEIANLKQRDQQQEDKINFILSKLNHSNSQK